MSRSRIHRHLRNEYAPTPGVIRMNTGVLIGNIVLLVAVVALLAYYVVQANSLTAFQFAIASSGEDVVALREVHHSIDADIADLEHPDYIAAYAQSAGMVLASDASYVSIPDSPLAGR